MANRLSLERRAAILSCLVEGCSLRSTARITGHSKVTVLKLLADLGHACRTYHDRVMRRLPCQRVEVDEIWTFANMRQKHVPEELRGVFGYGDVYTFHGICADSKLMIGWVVGRRDFETAAKFMDDLASRLESRVQLSTDGLRAFLEAVDWAFGDEIDYAQLIKPYGSDRGPDSDRMYASAKVRRTEKRIICGDPSIAHVSTSYIERQNLNLRMGMRRLTRLTNAFMRKVANLEHSLAIHVMHHNFVRKHRTLKTTPAIALGIEDQVWTVEDIVGLLEPGEHPRADR